MADGEPMKATRALTDRPNTVPWPPIIYLGAAVAAVGIQLLYPVPGSLPQAARRPVRRAGAAVMMAGAGLDASAIISMRRNKANIMPHRAATALVTSWPFSWSRNPIYLGNTLMLAGAAFVFGNLWFLVTTPVAVRMVTALAIRREEAHMAVLFGHDWQTYAGRVPRWLKPWLGVLPR